MTTTAARTLVALVIVALACLADAAPRGAAAGRPDTAPPLELAGVTREMRQMRAELGSANGRVSRLEATVQQQGEMLAALLAGKNEQEKAATKDIEAHVREEVAAQCEPAARRRAQGDAALSDSGVVRIFKRNVSLSHLSPNVDESNGGRQLLAEGGGGKAGCSNAAISRQMDATNVEISAATSQMSNALRAACTPATQAAARSLCRFGRRACPRLSAENNWEQNTCAAIKLRVVFDCSRNGRLGHGRRRMDRPLTIGSDS